MDCSSAKSSSSVNSISMDVSWSCACCAGEGVVASEPPFEGGEGVVGVAVRSWVVGAEESDCVSVGMLAFSSSCVGTRPACVTSFVSSSSSIDCCPSAGVMMTG